MRKIRNGAWYGNDTLWGSVLDVNRIVLYGRPDGGLPQQLQRSYLSVVDGIVAGEGNGPVVPNERASGVLLAGLDPLAVHLCAARLVGFDFHRIPQLAHALELHPLPLGVGGPAEIVVKSNVSGWADLWANTSDPFLNFTPADGWRQYTEIGN